MRVAQEKSSGRQRKSQERPRMRYQEEILSPGLSPADEGLIGGSTEHRYGGPWTEIKLDAVQYYLECYTKALKAFGFDIWYIDAFAGTGSRVVERVTGGILGEPAIVTKETLAGSVTRALQVRPAFDHYVFVEKQPTRCAALGDLQRSSPAADIRVIPGEANQVLRELVAQRPWRRRGQANSRGVVFLDPYALHVDWSTLQALASTEILDVWYLFPIRDTIRQLARNFEGIGPKEAMLDRVLGPEWRELYSIKPQVEPISDLFSARAPVEPGLERVVSAPQFERWLQGRLQTEFRFVSDPLPILKTPSQQLFSLFLGVSNPSRAATDLAQKFVRHVNKNFAPGASRRRFDREAFDRQPSC
jgi:three-Cys-motif partner protein